MNEMKTAFASSALLLSIIFLGAWVWEAAITRSPDHFRAMHEFHSRHSGK